MEKPAFRSWSISPTARSMQIPDNSSWLGNSTNDGLYGVTILNNTKGFVQAGDTAGTPLLQHRMWRGVTWSTLNMNPEEYCTIGSVIPGAAQFTTGSSMPVDGGFRAFNIFLSLTDGVQCMKIGTSVNINGFYCAQNVFEYIGTSNFDTINVTADSATATSTHFGFINNTMAGWWDYGRVNLLYCENTNSSILQNVSNNIVVQLNNKSDVFSSNGADVLNWAMLYGVDCYSNLIQYIDAANGGQGTSFAQAYPGLWSILGTQQTSSRHGALNQFTNYQGTTNSSIDASGGRWRGPTRWFMAHRRERLPIIPA